MVFFVRVDIAPAQGDQLTPPQTGEGRRQDEHPEPRRHLVGEREHLNIHPSIRLRIRHGLEERAEPYYS